MIIPLLIASIIISSSVHFQTDLMLLERQGRVCWGEKKLFRLQHSHLFVSLDLGVNESPQNVGCDGKVDEDQLRLLMEAEEREVVPQLHGLDGVFLLLTKRKRRIMTVNKDGRQESPPKNVMPRYPNGPLVVVSV